ncbi:MAG: hypothetical protein V7K64_03560 [Nostoc sp.]
MTNFLSNVVLFDHSSGAEFGTVVAHFEQKSDEVTNPSAYTEQVRSRIAH